MANNNCQCPLCAGYVVRIHRRYIDRVISWFVPVHRYKCRDYNCQWQGNLRY
jgi:hypothetical protein